VACVQVQNAHVRRWVAQMHSGGRSARGIALILSGWRGFYPGWAPGPDHHNPVQDVRAPKAGKPLPKALGVDDAVRWPRTRRRTTTRGLEARDRCITELLYGCGLRIGELVGWTWPRPAAARGWIDLQAGEAHVLGKGSQAAQRAGGPRRAGGAGALAGGAQDWARTTAGPVHRPPGASA
jgi:integrase/recombinase XerC